MKVLIAVVCFLNHDAVGNDVARQAACLKAEGISAAVFAEETDRPGDRDLLVSRDRARRLVRDADTLLIYHHSGCWDFGMRLLEAARCRVMIRYHNITPPGFFAPYSPGHEDFCRRGMAQTRRIAALGNVAAFACCSRFNARDFTDLGVPEDKIFVLPPFHTLADFETAGTDPELERRLSDGKVNLLFVGRLVPNKGHGHLIAVAAWYAAMYDRKIRVSVVGSEDPDLAGYRQALEGLAGELGVEDLVGFNGPAGFDGLNTHYRCADLFLLMSEHEGFCLPVLEAQFHGVPVIGLGAGAVPDTLGQDQLVFEGPDYRRIAAAVRVVTGTPGFREFLAGRGRNNLERFDNQRLEAQFLTAVVP